MVFSLKDYVNVNSDPSILIIIMLRLVVRLLGGISISTSRLRIKYAYTCR